MTNRIYLALLLTGAVALAPAVSSAADATIGLYTDAAGSSCSFSGNQPGLLTAYVVVRPGTTGVQSVRFSAPTPSCFDATFLTEAVPSPLASVGSSQTGITILSPGCETTSFSALQILYMSNGGTASCCAFSIGADPSTGLLEAFDCGNASTPISAITSHFNADASCACNVLPPAPPSIPQPPNGSTLREINQPLIWYSSDPGGLPMTAEIYFGTDPAPALVASDVPVEPYTTYWPGFFLTHGTTYYWRIVLRNSGGAETPGPVWSFTTKPNHPPIVSNLTPADGAIKLPIPLPFDLTWTASDPDGHSMSYDVYFGSTPSPPKVASNLPDQLFAAPGVQFATTYFWYVVARDFHGMETTGPTWSFTTKAFNEPPGVPRNPSPGNNATNQPVALTLRWFCNDPESGNRIFFDVYFGTSSPPPLVASNRTDNLYSPGPLEYATSYTWRVVARDSLGLETPGPTWTFTTIANLPPGAPYFQHPQNGSVDEPVTSYVFWDCQDPNPGQPLTFDVYFGTASPPPLVLSNITTKSYHPVLSHLTTYWWRVVARDPFGLTTSGTTNWFRTEALNLPPNAPANPMPASGSTNLPVNTKLSWEGSDPEGDVLEYDIYFGTAANPPLVYGGAEVQTYSPGTLAVSSAYRWRIVARDVKGHETSSPTWEFQTASNTTLPPSIPTLGYPADGSTTGPFVELHWFSSDPERTQLAYDIYLALDATPWEIKGVYHTTKYVVNVGPLVLGARYKWWVIARDEFWTVQGPTWTFTVVGPVPVLFSRFEASASPGSVTVEWEITADQDVATYALYRREDTRNEIQVASGPVDGTRGMFQDREVHAGATYSYELVITATDGSEFRSPAARATMPALELTLHQNVPNPFNPQTTIRYELPSPALVRLLILDVNGRVVRTLVNEQQTAGPRDAVWNGRDDAGVGVSSGVYFYVLEAGKDRLTRKLVLLK